MYARLFTRGWDVFAPGLPICFHQWQRSSRPHTWQQAAADLAHATEQPGHARGQAGQAAVVGQAGQAADKRAQERWRSQSKVRYVCGMQPWPGLAGEAVGAGSEQEPEPVSGPGFEPGTSKVGHRGGAEGQQGRGGVGVTAGGQSAPPGWQVGGMWGLGTVRSLAQLEEHLGVCFAAQTVSESPYPGLQTRTTSATLPHSPAPSCSRAYSFEL
ncbi:hypothetical protein V8C86DRAFT_567059 [Haematococcus lacustris]